MPFDVEGLDWQLRAASFSEEVEGSRLPRCSFHGKFNTITLSATSWLQLSIESPTDAGWTHITLSPTNLMSSERRVKAQAKIRLSEGV